MKKRESTRSGKVVLLGTKVCNQCNVETPIADNYYASNLSKCKLCVRKNVKQSVENDPEHKKEVDKKWRDDNKEHKKELDKKWRDDNVERKKETDTKYRELHKDDPVHIEMMKASRVKWKKANFEKWMANPKNRLIENTRSRIRMALLNTLNGKKFARSIKLLGCTPVFYIKWLEIQFDSYMNFDNYGSYWEIDHVIPCSKFNIILEDDQRACFHWTNTRPLDKIKNRSKNDSIVESAILLHSIKIHTFMKENNHSFKPNAPFDHIGSKFINKRQNQIVGNTLKI